MCLTNVSPRVINILRLAFFRYPGWFPAVAYVVSVGGGGQSNFSSFALLITSGCFSCVGGFHSGDDELV